MNYFGPSVRTSHDFTGKKVGVRESTLQMPLIQIGVSYDHTAL